MKTPSFFQFVKERRRRCKSQAFVEFAFILPIFLIMLMAIFDYSFMILRQQVMAMAAREAANTATRQLPVDGISVGLNAAYNSAQRNEWRRRHGGTLRWHPRCAVKQQSDHRVG